MEWLLTKRKLVLFSGFIIALFLGILLLNAHQISPPPHFDKLDTGSGLDALYAIGLAGLVLFLAAGLGQWIIKPFKLDDWTFIERGVISLPLGLAAIGYSEFFMGLAGFIQPIHHIVLLTLVSIISIKQSVSFYSEAFIHLKNFKGTWQRFSLIKKVMFTAGLLALTLALLQTFTPPYDYDSLMYHLQGPRLFLEAGKIIPIPENWFTYYPSTWGMLYMLGMGLGSDIFARLMHFSTLLLFIFSTYAVGKRYLPAPGGWIAAAIIVGMPIMLIWGGFSYIDIAWSLFQFLAVSLLLIWLQDRQDKYLVLSGVMQGLALGSKYLALFGAGILALCILGLSLRKTKTIGWKKVLQNPFIFGMLALLVASPWYLKNFIWTGNPVFPMYLPQNVIDPTELRLLIDYINSFGTGHQWYDYLLLPFSLYLNFKKFSTFAGSMDSLSPLYLLVFVYPWVRKKIHIFNREVLDVLLMVTALQFVAWAIGSQQTRFLMPLYPGLSILASAVLVTLPGKVKAIRWNRILVVSAVGGMLIASTAIMIRHFINIKPYNVITGLESKSEFLSSMLFDYQGIDFINKKLPEGAKVFMPWNGKRYYCDGKCHPDISQTKWVALYQKSKNLQETTRWFTDNGITHILLSWEDLYFFVTMHDPQNSHRDSAAFLVNEFLPNCTTEVYTDEWVQIFQINYNDNDQ